MGSRGNERTAFQIERIVEVDMGRKQAVCGDRHTIEQSEDGFSKGTRSARAGGGLERIPDVDRGRKALRTNMHDRLQSGDTARGPREDLANS